MPEQRTGLSGIERRNVNTETIDKVAELIEGLCEKLGTTAQYLIPELAKAYIASGIFNVIMWGIVTLVSGFLAFVFFMKSSDDEYEAAYIVIALVCLCVAIVGSIGLICCGEDLVAWIASPTAKAMMTIMDMIK